MRTLPAEATRPTRRPGIRALLGALLACTHFVAIPCAMAMTAPAPDDDCDHCDVIIEQQPCLAASDPACTDDPDAALERLRDPPRPLAISVPLFPVSAAIPAISGHLPRPDGAQSARGPTLRLLHCRFLE